MAICNSNNRNYKACLPRCNNFTRNSPRPRQPMPKAMLTMAQDRLRRWQLLPLRHRMSLWLDLMLLLFMMRATHTITGIPIITHRSFSEEAGDMVVAMAMEVVSVVVSTVAVEEELGMAAVAAGTDRP